jgi:hypothetical protein
VTVALITDADANPGQTGCLASLGVQPGQIAEIRSDSGRIHTVAEPEDTLRPGAAGTSRCLGDLPGTDRDPIVFGANPGWPLSLPVGIEDINGICA